MRSALNQAAAGNLTVANVDRKQRRRNPVAALHDLHPAAGGRRASSASARSARCGSRSGSTKAWTSARGPVGLITYMRTDSVNLAVEAVREIRSTIATLYGEEALPDAPRTLHAPSRRTRRKRTRPCARRRRERIPEKLARQARRATSSSSTRSSGAARCASQMEAAVFDTVAVDLDAGQGHVFRANGSTLITPGFLAVYRESFDDAASTTRTTGCSRRWRSAIASGCSRYEPEQHFTEPPPRYSEASLVKALEEHGIGRPSTYASIIQTLLYKKYCELLNKRFVPTDLGKIVNRFLTRQLRALRRLRLHGRDGGRARQHLARRGGLGAGARAVLGGTERADRRRRRERHAAGRFDGTRTSVPIPFRGKPVSVRYGRYGAFAQIGTREDEEKPKFASLRPHQRMDTLTLPEALELFKLPRVVGQTDDGHPIRIAIGRFGPYVQFGAEEIRLAQGRRRPVHDHAGARARSHPREARDRGQPHHPRVSRGRHPGAERPLRAVHYRRQAQRAGSEGPRPEVAHARGMQDAAGSRPTATRTLGTQDPFRRQDACRRSAADRDRRAGETEGCDAPKGKDPGGSGGRGTEAGACGRARGSQTSRAQEGGTQASAATGCREEARWSRRRLTRGPASSP